MDEEKQRFYFFFKMQGCQVKMQGSQAKPHVPAHGEGMARAWSWNGTRRARSRTTYTRSAWYAYVRSQVANALQASSQPNIIDGVPLSLSITLRPLDAAALHPKNP